METFLRQGDGTWQYALHAGVEAAAALVALEVVLPLAEVFAGVEFPQPLPLRLLPKV